MIEENKTIVARNCKIPVVNGHMRMIVDAFGKIEISKDFKVQDVKKENDLSANTIDNFSVKTKNKNNDKKSRFNDGSSVQTYGTEFI